MVTTATSQKIKYLSERSTAGKAAAIIRADQQELSFQVYSGGNHQDLLGHRGQCQTEGVRRRQADQTEKNCLRRPGLCQHPGRGERCVGGGGR